MVIEVKQGISTGAVGALIFESLLECTQLCSKVNGVNIRTVSVWGWGGW